MGKQIKLIALIFCVLLLVQPCNAVSIDNDELSGFFENAPDEIRDIYVNDGFKGLSDILQFDNILKIILNLLESQFKNCVSIFITLSVIILFFAFAEKLEFNNNDTLKNITSAIISVTLLSLSFEYLKTNIELIKESITTMKVFTTSALPIVVSICISAGETFSATVVSTALTFICATFEFIADKLIMPLITVYVCFSVVGTINDRFNSAIINTYIKKFIKWIIGLFIGIFTTVLSMQNLLARASDNFAKRAIKLAVGNLIPVIGSTISGSIDGLFALGASTKTTLSVAGSIIIVVIFSSNIIGCLCYGTVYSISKMFASFMKVKSIENVLVSISDSFFILSAVSATCVYVMVISFVMICFNI